MFLNAYLKSRIYNNSHIDDVVQEVLLAVHKSRHTFDPTKSFTSWLLAITHYKLSDHLRQQFKTPTQNVDDQIIDEKSDALTSLIENEKMQFLEKAINELEPRSKEVISLLKVSGLKVSEVAIKMNLTESNVKIIAHRAYEKLEAKLRSKL